VQPTARRKAPEEAAEAFAAYNAGDYGDAIAKQLMVIEKQPDASRTVARALLEVGCLCRCCSPSSAGWS
jgi:hypothetical protein